MKLLLSTYTTSILFGFNFSLSDTSYSPENEVRFYSDITIDSSEIWLDNIRILGGALKVHGTVEGQIILIGGDVHIFSSAVVNGKIIAIGGNVQTDEGAQINGKIVETGIDQGLIYRETGSDSAESGKKNFESSTFPSFPREDWLHPEPKVLEYNRNEGLRFSPLHWKRNRDNDSMISWIFSLGYRFGSDEFIGRFTLETAVLKHRPALLFASVFKTSRTDDEFRLPERENSWAGFLARHDFYDRWNESGLEAGFGLDFSRLKVKGKFVRSTQSEISVHENLWSVTNGSRNLRTNPTMTKTDTEYWEGEVVFRTKSHSPLATGLIILSKMEIITISNDTAINDPVLHMLHMATGIYKITEKIILRNRVMVGMGSESLQDFRRFGIGGLGSVSAHGYKALKGTHMAQWNSELFYTFQHNEPWLLVKLFYDAGSAYLSTGLMNFEPISDNNNLLQSAGIGFGFGTMSEFDLGLNFAKPLDSAGSIESTIRLNFNF